MRILVVEDDRSLSDVLRRGLAEEGYSVDLCSDGAEGLAAARVGAYDAIILDVMLPSRDGFEICRELRSSGIGVPILMLTARDALEDTVTGLESGADDYLHKPFAFRELRARLRTIMRRTEGASSGRLQAGDLVVDAARREVLRAGERISLTNREFQILAYLMRSPGRVLTRIMIEDWVWGHDYPGLSNTVDVHIKRLRGKIDSPGLPSLIETIRGAGYRWRSPGP